MTLAKLVLLGLFITLVGQCAELSDSVNVLDAIVGFYPREFKATKEAAEFISVGGYKEYMEKNDLRKEISMVRNPFLELSRRAMAVEVTENIVPVL